jgi:hypothetical protein
VSWRVGIKQPYFQRLLKSAPELKAKTNELGKSTQFYCRSCFSQIKLLKAGRTIVDPDGVGLSMLRNITTLFKPQKSLRKNQYLRLIPVTYFHENSVLTHRRILCQENPQ